MNIDENIFVGWNV